MGELKTGSVRLVQWSPPKPLTANRWCPLPEWTNGKKYLDSVRHTHKYTLILQEKRLMGDLKDVFEIIQLQGKKGSFGGAFPSGTQLIQIKCSFLMWAFMDRQGGNMFTTKTSLSPWHDAQSVQPQK